MKNKVKENDVVMCTVKSIEGASVFLLIEGNGEGSMVMSEVAAGRIRNLREYVFPNKKVVCKVLDIDADGYIHLSLRRVTGKEREAVQKKHKKERTFFTLLKKVFARSEPLIEKIKEKYDLVEFFDRVKEQPRLLEEFISASDAQKLAPLLAEKRDKEKSVKKTFVLKSFSETGIHDMKYILAVQQADIRYLGSSRFSISIKGSDFKDAAHNVDAALAEIEKRAKERKALFEVKEK